MASGIPRWVEALLVRAIREYIPASVIHEAYEHWKDDVIAMLKEKAADTANKIDDVVVQKVEEALGACTPDSALLCEIIQGGKAFLFAHLRQLASASETQLDDAVVDLLEEAFA